MLKNASNMLKMSNIPRRIEKKASHSKKQCPLVGNSPKNVSYYKICFSIKINRWILVYFIKFLVNIANVLGKPRTFAILTSNLMK